MDEKKIRREARKLISDYETRSRLFGMKPPYPDGKVMERITPSQIFYDVYIDNYIVTFEWYSQKYHFVGINLQDKEQEAKEILFAMLKHYLHGEAFRVQLKHRYPNQYDLVLKSVGHFINSETALQEYLEDNSNGRN